MKYLVLDGNKKAMYPDCKVDKSWNNCIFDTKDEAIEYINKWLGIYSPGIEELKKAFSDSDGYEYYPKFYISIEIVNEFNSGKSAKYPLKITVRQLMQIDPYMWQNWCEMHWEEMKGCKMGDMLEICEEDAKKLGLA